MGEMITSFWACSNMDNTNNHEDMEELGQKLLCTTLELEKLKSEVVEEMSKNKEHVKRLAHLLTLAIKERDEARDQLHKILATKTTTTATATTITASNNFPRIPNTNTIKPPNTLGMSSGFSTLVGPTMSPVDPMPDHASLIIDALAEGRPLPPKGKLLRAVQDAGPLLQTLLLAGPLPRWRNPPPALQLCQAPPVSLKRTWEAGGNLVSSFGNVASGTCNNGIASGLGFDQFTKRARLC